MYIVRANSNQLLLTTRAHTHQKHWDMYHCRWFQFGSKDNPLSSLLLLP